MLSVFCHADVLAVNSASQNARGLAKCTFLNISFPLKGQRTYFKTLQSESVSVIMDIWDKFKPNQYVGLQPWVWVQLESSEPPGPFPFMGGVAPDVMASLHEVHSILLSSVETAISDVFARRTTLDDPHIRTRLEDAYAEVVQTRPRLQEHIHCGRNTDGTFFWEFSRDQDQSAVMNYAGLRLSLIHI